MKKFLVLYKSDRNAAEVMANTTPDQMKESMGAWIAWKEKVGEGMVEFGLPLNNATAMKVTKDGVEPKETKINGYSIVQAEDMDAAVEMLKSHPQLQHDTKLVVLEMLPMPGM